MNLFRLILLFFVLMSPIKANTIYNLIKIPNLEIYEINTENRLKYFYASASFRLGVMKNIVCHNSDKKNLDKKYKMIHKNLNRYSHTFLKEINLKYIVLCENLSISGINTAGIPDNIMKTLILDIQFNKTYFEILSKIPLAKLASPPKISIMLIYSLIIVIFRACICIS